MSWFSDIFTNAYYGINDAITGAGKFINDLGSNTIQIGQSVIGGVSDWVSNQVVPSISQAITDTPKNVNAAIDYMINVNDKITSQVGKAYSNIISQPLDSLGKGIGTVTSNAFGSSWFTAPVIISVAAVAGLIMLKL